MLKQERNQYIDFIKGLAIINIVLIHTAFWSGDLYVPKDIRNILLLFDVPIFFYLSGWGRSYKKPSFLKSILSMKHFYLTYACFVFIEYILILLISLRSSSYTYMYAILTLLVRDLSFLGGTPNLKNTFWFAPYYILVNLLNSFLLSRLHQKQKAKEVYLSTIVLLFLLVSFLKLDFDFLKYFLFYDIFWMLGYLHNSYKNSSIWNYKALAFVIITLVICLCSYCQDLPLWDIQTAKFPPSPKYMFTSLYQIIILNWFEGQFRNNKHKFIEHVGKNSLIYLFVQSVSSFVLYFVYYKITINSILIKFTLLFFLNLCTTITFSEMFIKVKNKITEYNQNRLIS